MDMHELEKLADSVAKEIKTSDDLARLDLKLKKLIVERALNAEMDLHLGHKKNLRKQSSNVRNGQNSKTLITSSGSFELNTPRDREGTFEPQLVKKYQTRFTSMDDQILYLYSKGLTNREIVQAFKELYGADVSASLISKVTDAVKIQVTEWQNRPLEALYPIVYLDAIHLKVRQNNSIVNKAILLALGVTLAGDKELLGLWLFEAEGAKLWLKVLTELQNRGVQDVLIVCVDGLKGFPEAIQTVFPKARIQLCIVHMVRNSLRYVSYKHYKAITQALKSVYQAPTEEAALLALEAMAADWDDRYPQISKRWQNEWEHIRTLFDYPPEIKRIIYTTNAIESVNSVIRQAIRKRKVFSTDDAARKVVFLAIQEASKRWSRPLQNWGVALGRFMIEFEDRMKNHV